MFIPESGLLKNSNTFFHTPSKVAHSTFLYMLCAGEFFCDGNYNVVRDNIPNYPNYLIMYIKEGCGTVVFDQKTYSAKANDVILLNCHKPHAYYTNTGWVTLWVHFEGIAAKEFFELLYNRFGVVLSLNESNIIQKNMSIIIDRLKESKPLPESAFSYYLYRMLTEMIMLSSDYPESDKFKVNLISDAITYIETNYNNKITLNELTAYVNISPFHFSRIFKKETGYSPYEYVIKTRINKAKEMLKNTKMSIKEIAFNVGYEYESSFIDIFHKLVNYTPNEFRNMRL